MVFFPSLTQPFQQRSKQTGHTWFLGRAFGVGKDPLFRFLFSHGLTQCSCAAADQQAVDLPMLCEPSLAVDFDSISDLIQSFELASLPLQSPNHLGDPVILDSLSLWAAVEWFNDQRQAYLSSEAEPLDTLAGAVGPIYAGEGV